MKVDNTDFKVDKSVAAAPSQTPSGIEVSFDITYEPSSLGEFKSTLVLASSLGGEFVFPLHGVCLPPKPQGPYQVRAGSTSSIAFKNVFGQPVAYSFAIDNELFHLTKTTELIKPHQTYKIVVGFNGNDSASSSTTAASATATTNKADVMAKLVVTASKSAGTNKHVQWIYYLKGTS